MDTAPAEEGLPPSLRFLKALVIVLTITMIVGVIVVVSLLVIRFPVIKPTPPGAPLPESIALPDGTRATAFTQGGDWYAIVTADDQILIYDRATSTLRQTIILTKDNHDTKLDSPMPTSD